MDSPTFIDALLISEIDGTLLVGLVSMFHSSRVYAPADEGASWEVAFESEHGFHFWDLVETRAGDWFFCTEDAAHIANAVVMRSTDRGASWEEMVPLTGIPTAGHGLNLEVHPTTDAIYFLTESSFLRSSMDGGDSWSAGDYVDFGSVLLIDPNHPDRFFGGELVRGTKVGGVYLSEDAGGSFVYLGPAGASIASLAIDGASTRLYAVAYGVGIFVQELD